jgi:DNA-binding IclR family transcriptional regulator
MANEHRTVSRIASILERAASSDGVSVATLARELNAPKSSIHSLVNGLIAVGYLSQKQFLLTLGPAVDILVPGATMSGVQVASRPELVSLASVTGESAILAARVGDSAVYFDQVASHQEVRYVAEIGRRRPLFRTALGKALIADQPQSALKHLLSGLGPEERSAIVSELAEAARTGIAYNLGESVPGVYGVSSPIRNVRGETVAALSIAGPESRMRPKLEAFGAEVLAASKRVSAALGFKAA